MTSHLAGAGTIVVGAGSAGAVVAARLAERGEDVLLVEAGPDYGPLAGGHWPADLLDATVLPESHQWDLDSGSTYPDRTVTFGRARVVGGCSAHNGCAAIWGSRLDYDGWRDLGCPGWGTDDIVPFLGRATERLRVRIPAREELTPFQGGFLEAAPAAGIPSVPDLNDLDQDTGVGPNPVNVVGRSRWSTALAYLDPVRSLPTLRIAPDALVDRVLLDGTRCRGIVLAQPGGTVEVPAARVVLAAGTYGSPAILLRSGVGDPASLARLGVPLRCPLPGVGRNLHDHPLVGLVFEGTEELLAATRSFSERRWAPDEQVIAKVRSHHCRRGFDLHLFPYSHQDPGAAGGWRWVVNVAGLTPRSRGRLELASADPSVSPLIDHRYVSDAGGEDARALVAGIEIARTVVAEPGYGRLLGRELAPGPDVRGETALAGFVRATCAHYFHPAGTCRMGPAPDGGAVVDARGAVHGLEGLHVADASIMPVLPRANTNIPAAAIGERIASLLAD